MLVPSPMLAFFSARQLDSCLMFDCEHQLDLLQTPPVWVSGHFAVKVSMPEGLEFRVRGADGKSWVFLPQKLKAEARI